MQHLRKHEDQTTTVDLEDEEYGANAAADDADEGHKKRQIYFVRKFSPEEDVFLQKHCSYARQTRKEASFWSELYTKGRSQTMLFTHQDVESIRVYSTKQRKNNPAWQEKIQKATDKEKKKREERVAAAKKERENKKRKEKERKMKEIQKMKEEKETIRKAAQDQKKERKEKEIQKKREEKAIELDKKLKLKEKEKEEKERRQVEQEKELLLEQLAKEMAQKGKQLFCCCRCVVDVL